MITGIVSTATITIAIEVTTALHYLYDFWK